MEICEKCNEITFPSKGTGVEHHCTKFIITTEDGGVFEQYGINVEVALARFAESYDIDNESILMDSSEIVTVNDVKYKIRGETTISYYAERI